MTSRPLVCLSMIVRNEASGIAETLRSAIPAIDCWCILDTGSTDGTPDLIRETLAGIPGDLFTGPFHDYGTARNRALGLTFAMQPQPRWVLLLNGDDVLHGAEKLRTALATDPAANRYTAHALEVRQGRVAFPHPRIVAGGSDWRYIGPTHELLASPSGAEWALKTGVHIAHDESRRTAEGMRARWTADLAMLDVHIKEDRNNPRWRFYRGQTLECLGRMQEALADYIIRAHWGGDEEAAVAAWRGSRISHALASGECLLSPGDEHDGLMDTSVHLSALAVELAPGRVEAHLAAHVAHAACGNEEDANRAARAALAAAKNPPLAGLFLESALYGAAGAPQAVRTYCIKPGYRINTTSPKWPGHGVDQGGRMWQRHVYEKARWLCEANGLTTVLDLGCGDADKAHLLSNLFIYGVTEDASIIPSERRSYLTGVIDGIDLDAECNARDAFGGADDYNFYPTDTLVLCSDVIEHVLHPERLLARIHALGCLALISTPDRDLIHGTSPPGNPYHVREWTAAEFREFITGEGFEIVGEWMLPAYRDRDGACGAPSCQTWLVRPVVR